jgi:DnaK suppressor protein
MSHLTPAQLSELKEELERQLEKLERSMQVTAEAAAPVELDQTSVGRLSRMDSLQNQGLTRNLQEREEMKLILLQEAFARLEGGSYGLCVTCGGEIPFERLYVFPEAPSCSSCADSP